MLNNAHKSARRRNWIRIALALCFCFCTVSLHPQIDQPDVAFEKIHQRLTNKEKLTYHRPFVFVGEITALGPVFQGVCKTAVNQSVDFSVSRVLFGKFSETVLHAGFINCTREPLPSPPFTLHASVIVYCEQLHFTTCLTPVPFTEQRQKLVEKWITAIPPDLATQEDRGDTTLWTLHAPLEDPDRMAKRQGFYFEGEITRNEEIRQHRCASGVEHKIAYSVTQVLWDYPDSLLRPGYIVSKDFIDCRKTPLPKWGPETRVINYCEALPGQGYSCLAPVMSTGDRMFRVKKWLTDLSTTEGNPELLKMHWKLRDSLELAPTRPLLVLGKVISVTPKHQFGYVQSVAMLPTMRLSVARLFWGYYKAPEVVAVCPHRDCSSVAVGVNVIAYCESMGVYYGPPANCWIATPDASDANLKLAEQWAAQAREHQRALIVENIRKYVEAHPGDSRATPSVYRGHATWIGKDDNGLPLIHFADTTGKFPQAINVLIQRHYSTEAPIAVELGKPMITFCVQRDDVCYVGDETTGVIEDSDQTFRAIQQAIEGSR